MKNALIAILLSGAAVVACNAQQDADKIEAKSGTEISVDANSDANSDGRADIGDDGGVNIRANMESGEVQLKLPGGLEGTVKIPGGLESESQFDLDGVGRYPGSRLTTVNVVGTRRDGEGSGQVVLGFTAPGTAGQVADWYQKALAAKGRTPSRSANTLTSQTADGDRMVIAVQDGPTGIARGRITITDKKG